MTQKIFRNNFSVILFLFFASVLDGIVLLGTSQAISFMLSERGVCVSTITRILLVTVPYSWKFAMSPFIKNLILKNKIEKVEKVSSRASVCKTMLYASQFIVLIGFSSIGLFEKAGSLVLLSVVIFITVIATSVLDILRAYVMLNSFEGKELGIVTSVESAGFRIGMILSGACLFYMANAIGWKTSYLIIGGAALITLASTLFMSEPSEPMVKNTSDQNTFYLITDYFKVCFKFFKKHGVFLLIFIFISFKFSDSCINGLKGMFLYSLGIGKVLFVNISFLAGLFCMMISGALGGWAVYKIGSERCIKLSFGAQCIASSIFIFLSLYKIDIMNLALLINISTLIFGFSNVVFRTFVAERSNGDVNIYTMMLSVGSAIRVLSYSMGGEIVNSFSWTAMYIVCLISCIPGLFSCSRLFYRRYEKEKN
ncbi:MAG: MFS transporter [Holosporales bacterium]|jgi:PAT family beta-lactamase induction signal transducer AmpG|nr:MFS transporter [Holosporales bacterium]